MERNKVIEEVITFVKDELKNAERGHDWWHIYRVWNLSKIIARDEDANLFVVELGSLLHDIADPKFHDGDEEIGPRKAGEFLKSLGVEGEVIAHIERIISNVSFKGRSHIQKFRSKELDIVQDADRLEALGAIGIARAFNYGGYKNREIHNPNIKPNLNMTREEYIQAKGPTINHFYEKLLLLKNRMNTRKGKEIAQKRHEFIELYLKRFFDEWEGKV